MTVRRVWESICRRFSNALDESGSKNTEGDKACKKEGRMPPRFAVVEGS